MYQPAGPYPYLYLSNENIGNVHYNNQVQNKNTTYSQMIHGISSPSSSAVIVENLTLPAPGSEIQKPKRERIVYSSDQIITLERQFIITQYLTRSRRTELAEELKLTESQVKIWFQNRRMKAKKENAKDYSHIRRLKKAMTVRSLSVSPKSDDDSQTPREDSEKVTISERSLSVSSKSGDSYQPQFECHPLYGNVYSNNNWTNLQYNYDFQNMLQYAPSNAYYYNYLGGHNQYDYTNMNYHNLIPVQQQTAHLENSSPSDGISECGNGIFSDISKWISDNNFSGGDISPNE